MNAQLKEYLEDGNYLPDFMRDFHDQKLLFKRLDEINRNRKDSYTDNVSWIAGQVYTVDIFLWFMACHGYTLQKSRKKVDFYDIHNDLSVFEQKQREISANVISQMFKKNKESSDSEKETD